MATFTKVARAEFPSTDSKRIGQVDVNYVYRDELMNMYFFTLPKDEDTVENVREELRKRSEEAKLGGPETVEL